MAVRIDAAADYLSRTASMPSGTLFSWCGWVYLAVDRNASGVIFVITNAGGTEYCRLALGADGTTLTLSLNGSATTGTSLAISTWYHIAYTRNVAEHRVYLNGVLDISVSNNNTLTTPSTIGQGSNTVEWISGRLAALKLWDAELTANEIISEMWSYLPRRLANINYACPLLQHTLLTDVSINQRSQTANGTLTTEDGPPITWAPRRWRIWRPGAAGGVTVDLAADPATAVWSAVDPTVVLGSLALDLSASPASGAWSAVDPTVIHGSLALDLSADPASAAWSAVDPTVILGSLSLDLSGDVATAAWSAVDPSVILGSLSIDLSADPATASWSAVDPTVVIGDGNITVDLSGDPAVAVWSAVDPTIILSSVSVDLSADPASAAWSAVDPTVIHGSLALDLAALPATAIWSAADPTVIHGSLAIDLSGDVATAAWTAVDPTIVLGSMTVDLSADPALAAWSVVDPTVVVAAAALPLIAPLSGLLVGVGRSGTVVGVGRSGTVAGSGGYHGTVE